MFFLYCLYWNRQTEKHSLLGRRVHFKSYCSTLFHFSDLGEKQQMQVLYMVRKLDMSWFPIHNFNFENFRIFTQILWHLRLSFNLIPPHLKFTTASCIPQRVLVICSIFFKQITAFVIQTVTLVLILTRIWNVISLWFSSFTSPWIWNIMKLAFTSKINDKETRSVFLHDTCVTSDQLLKLIMIKRSFLKKIF